MTDLRKAAEQALEALAWGEIAEAKEHLRQALAEDALKKLAEIDHSLGLFIDAPPKREWVGLTDEERQMHIRYGSTLEDIALSIEAKLKEKNT